MENEVLIILAEREGYSIDQVRRTMTVGELIEALQEYDEDTPIYLSHDSGYTYGGILESRMEVQYMNDDEDEEE